MLFSLLTMGPRRWQNPNPIKSIRQVRNTDSPVFGRRQLFLPRFPFVSQVEMRLGNLRASYQHTHTLCLFLTGPHNSHLSEVRIPRPAWSTAVIKIPTPNPRPVPRGNSSTGSQVLVNSEIRGLLSIIISLLVHVRPVWLLRKCEKMIE
jgi:hypothetical protein